MKKILLIGAGRSASSLIKYLLDNSAGQNWRVTVADVSLEIAHEKVRGHSNANAIALDITNDQQREQEISDADLIISMLPAAMHYSVARDCVKLKKHLITASYVSKEIKDLNETAQAAGIILMNEIGLDPGIDHMSAMQIIDRIKQEGGELKQFKSYTGGLVAPESNDNPWGYKFSWNPRNVILAGQGIAQFIENGKYKYIPYNRLFSQIEKISIEGYGNFEGYANRDSLSYRESYGLDNISTLLRGTLRMPGYCEAWNVFVKLGWTDDTYKVVDSDKMTYSSLLEAYLPEGEGSLKVRLAKFMGIGEDSEIIRKIEWLDIFQNRPVRLSNASPAQILQGLLEEKWQLGVSDIDMIVMQHQFEYEFKGEIRKITSSLVVKGEDQIYTAMAKTVGIPVGIAAKLILNGQINLTGVQIPTSKEVYEPVLKELESFGVVFKENVS